MTDKLNLPFDFNTDSLELWIAKLGKLEHKVAASHLYNALKKINSANSSLKNLILVFDTLTPITLHLADCLLIRPETAKHNQEKTAKLSQLNYHLVRALARGFFEMTNHPDFQDSLTISEQIRIISKAIDYYAQTQKLCALNYDYPSSSTWKNLGTLYQRSEKVLLQKKNDADKKSVAKELSEITKNVKASLLFAIFNPYFYNPNEILAFDLFFQQHANQLEISRTDQKNHFVATSFWDYHSSNPPQPNKPLRAEVLLINADKIVDLIYSSTFFSGDFSLPKEIRRTIQTRLASYCNIFSYITPSPPEVVNIIHGFDRVVHYYAQKNQRNRFFQASPKSSPNLQHKILDIEPMEKQSGETQIASINEGWDAINSPDVLSGSYFQTQNPDFSIILLQDTSFELNQLAIVNNDKKMIFGIIRQRQNAPVIKAQQYCMESMHGSISRITICGNDTNKRIGLLLDRRDGTLEIFLKPEKMTTGSKIQIIADKYSGDYSLTRLIEVTAHFMRYRVCSCS